MDAEIGNGGPQQRLRILVLCYEYPPLGGGGGRVAKTIARKLASRGHTVRVITGGMPHLAAIEEDAGVEVLRVRSGRKHEDRCSIPEMLAWCAAALVPTLQAVNAWKPDVIHAHFAIPTGMLAWAVHRLTRVPYVVTAHLGDVPGAFFARDSAVFKSIEPIAGRIWREASEVTGVSSFVAEAGAEAYGRPVVMIPNGVEITDTTLAQTTRQPGSPRLVFTGRFVEQKRPLLLLEILAKLGHLPWHLTMIGDGPLMPGVRNRIDQLALRDRVTLRGWLDSASVHAVLRDSDIFCLPSTSEGLPVAAVEALHHGLVIAGSDIPGLRDVLVDQVNGRAVPVHDPAAFIAAFRELLTDRDQRERMKSASKTKAREFDLDHITARYEEVLTRASRDFPRQ